MLRRFGCRNCHRSRAGWGSHAWYAERSLSSSVPDNLGPPVKKKISTSWFGSLDAHYHGCLQIGSLSVIGLPAGGFISKWYLALGALIWDAMWVVGFTDHSAYVFYLLPVAITAFFERKNLKRIKK